MGKTRLMISNHPKPVPRTNKAKPPTWGQLKKLTIEGEELVKEQGQPLTSATLFLAVLSVVTTTSGSQSPRKSRDRTWKQPRCLSADEWIRKLWYIYTMEYYAAIKMNAFESILMRWMKLEPIIQSKVSQKEKHQYSILTHVYGI